MKETGLLIVLYGPVNESILIIVLYINEETSLFNVLYGPVNESWLITVLYINELNQFV